MQLIKNNNKNTIKNKFNLKISNQEIKSKELKVLCKQMSILLKSGCKITRILNILHEQSSKNLKTAIEEISINIKNGNSITESFEKTNLFSSFFINMLLAGELSGNLDKIMNDLSKYYDSEEKLKSKIISISIYPIILIIISMISGFFILVFIIPNFQMIFETNGINPPLLTKILLKLSVFIREKCIYIVFAVLTSILLIYYLVKYNSRAKYIKDKLKLKLPFIGEMMTLLITTRFCKTLNILFESGVNIVDSIDISSRVVDNILVYEKLSISREYIRRGNNISYSISKSGVFPNSFISMIKIGEESGSLDNTLSVSSDFYSEKLDLKIEKTMKLIEPMITVIIGLVIGLFIIAMVIPMFDAINSIQ
ncbi:MAG: type II secretion system F family protein [Romboutsia sp.]|nr:type II secretion system F family protein [Romboutsia sp.]